MNDRYLDELAGDQGPDPAGAMWDRILWSVVITAMVILTLVAFTAGSGCVTMAKEIIIPTPEPTPPIPEPTPTPEPTPEPEPVSDWTQCGIQDGCYNLRDWHHWFRANVTGINTELGSRDLATHATVYNYKIFPSIHYHDPLWGTRAYFKESPNPGYVYLFVFLNIYSDGDDVRQYGYHRDKFLISIRDQLYYPTEPVAPQNRIKELDELWDYAHIDSPVPWGYRIIQEAGSGIMRSEYLDYIYTGRSNSWDGFIMYEIPAGTDLEEVRLAASFDNLGGNAFWKLV